MLERSLDRQDNLAQEDGNTGVKYTRDRETIGRRWDTLGSGTNQTHLGDKTRQEVGNRRIWISKQEGKH